MDYLQEPWAHQREAIELASKLANFGFFFEMGAGKTSTAINTIRKVWNEKKRLPRTLIFCPPIVIENWKAEWLKNSKIPGSNITCLYGPGKKRLATFMKRCVEPHIFITNYESLSMEDLYEAMVTWQPEVVIFDEIHKLKDYKAKRSKLAERLVNNNMRVVKQGGYQTLEGPRPYVYGLSGSPILNNAMDLFQQYKILDAGKTFGMNFFSFRGRFFFDKNAGMNKQNHFPDWRPLPGALEEISKLMRHNSMRVLKKDCMDLPPFVRKTITIPMAPQQRKLYEQMLQEFVTYFEKDGKEHVATATIALTKGMRLMQLASGYVKTVGDEEVSVTDGWNPKQEALYEILEELVPNHKVIIWAVWKENYRQIRSVLEKLGIEWVEVHGDIAGKDKFLNVDRFNGDPKCRVLFGHPGSGGVGVNMVAASYSLFYSRNFSLEQDLQAEARNYRGGSEIHEKVTRIDLVTENSIEGEIVEKLAKKEAIGIEILKEITRQGARV